MRSPRTALVSAGAGVTLVLGTLLAAPAQADPTPGCQAARHAYQVALGVDHAARQRLATDEAADAASEASDPPDTAGSPGRPAVPAVPGTPAVPAVPATPAVPAGPNGVPPAVPATPGSPAVPAVPGTPAVPAVPAVPAFHEAHDPADAQVARDSFAVNDPQSGTAVRLALALKTRQTECDRPTPVVIVGDFTTVPPDQAERRRLVQVCVDTNRGLLGAITIGVLTRDCEDRVPPCPLPPVCDHCPPVVVHPPVVIDQQPPVVITRPGPVTVVQQPGTTIVEPGPGTSQIGTPPSGFVQTGSVDPADRFPV